MRPKFAYFFSSHTYSSFHPIHRTKVNDKYTALRPFCKLYVIVLLPTNLDFTVSAVFAH